MNLESQKNRAQNELGELLFVPLAQLTDDQRQKISELQTAVRNLGHQITQG